MQKSARFRRLLPISRKRIAALRQLNEERGRRPHSQRRAQLQATARREGAEAGDARRSGAQQRTAAARPQKEMDRPLKWLLLRPVRACVADTRKRCAADWATACRCPAGADCDESAAKTVSRRRPTCCHQRCRCRRRRRQHRRFRPATGIDHCGRSDESVAGESGQE